MNEPYTIQDSLATDAEGNPAWVRVFCCPLSDGSCSLLLFQQHYAHVCPYFDHVTEANMGIVSGGSLKTALRRIEADYPETPNVNAYRRLSRLMSSGSLMDEVIDTLHERKLQRAVAYAESDDKPADKRLAIFERAGFVPEERSGKTVYVLELG